MAGNLIDRVAWTMDRDNEGHRDYHITWLIHTDFATDGPYVVLFTSGLPSVGANWSFGGDSDPWAFCWPNAKIRPVLEKERNRWWTLEQTFSTKPLSRCQSTNIENPLNEPPKISGTFAKFVRKAGEDRHGDPIFSTSHEPIEVEKDDNRPTVNIEKNFLQSQLATFSPVVDSLNDATLWGLGPRKIKLSNVTWERKLYGICTFYYPTRYEFEIDFNGWDRKYRDKGRRVLVDGGDPTDVNDFVALTDDKGDPLNDPVALKDGKLWKGPGAATTRDIGGVTISVSGDAEAGFIQPELYDETNLLALGIPATL